MAGSVFEEGQSLRLGPGLAVSLDALREQASRSSGPGGQCVNKLETAVELWVAVDAIVGLDDDAKGRLRVLAGSRLTKNDEVHLRTETHRSQRDNRQTNREKLAELVGRAKVRPVPRKKTRPGRAARQRRLDAKKQQGEKKSRRAADRLG